MCFPAVELEHQNLATHVPRALELQDMFLPHEADLKIFTLLMNSF